MTVETTSASSSLRHSLKRRAAYSVAAGAAAFAATSGADAEVIYSGVKDFTVLPGFPAFYVDLDNNGLSDVKFRKENYFGGAYFGSSVLGTGQVVGFISGLKYVTALTAGQEISPATVGPTFYGSMAYGAANPNAQFNLKTDAFVGLSFNIGANLNYGWVRVTTNQAAGLLKITGWAYETTPGTGILAGAIPEPTTLGLLAAGALGVTALRRKRAA
jgi:hypothetical protein